MRNGPSFFQKAQQASRQGPDTQDSLSGHQLVLIAAQQVLVKLDEGLDLLTDRQDVDQSLCAQVEQGAAELAHRLQRLVQIVASEHTTSAHDEL